MKNMQKICVNAQQSPVYAQTIGVCTQKNPLHTYWQQSPIDTQKSPIYTTKSPIYNQKSPVYTPKDACLHSKDLCIHSKEPKPWHTVYCVPYPWSSSGSRLTGIQ